MLRGCWFQKSLSDPERFCFPTQYSIAVDSCTRLTCLRVAGFHIGFNPFSFSSRLHRMPSLKSGAARHLNNISQMCRLLYEPVPGWPLVGGPRLGKLCSDKLLATRFTDQGLLSSKTVTLSAVCRKSFQTFRFFAQISASRYQAHLCCILCSSARLSSSVSNFLSGFSLRWWKVSASEVGEKPFILARLSLANLDVQNTLLQSRLFARGGVWTKAL